MMVTILEKFIKLCYILMGLIAQIKLVIVYRKKTDLSWNYIMEFIIIN